MQHEELALYHGRDVSAAELACLASHAAAWRAAEAARLDWVVVLEDDVVAHCGADWGGEGAQHARLWARVWWQLTREVAALHATAHAGAPAGGGSVEAGRGADAAAAAAAAGGGAEAEATPGQAAWELLYLGRNRLGRDGAAVGERLVVPGFSSCAHAYALSRGGYQRLLRRNPTRR